MSDAQTTEIVPTWGTREFGNFTRRRDRDDAETWARMGASRDREAVVVITVKEWDRLTNPPVLPGKAANDE